MNIKYIFPPLFILLLATIVATNRPSSAVALDKGPAAFGEGQFTFFGEVVNFSFHAKLHKNGIAKGRAEFENLSDQTKVVVDIDCLSVDTALGASMSGTVKRSDDPAFPEAAKVLFAAIDGEGPLFPPEDQITPLFIFPPFPGATCHNTAPLTILPLDDGEIRVEP